MALEAAVTTAREAAVGAQRRLKMLPQHLGQDLAEHGLLVVGPRAALLWGSAGGAGQGRGPRPTHSGPRVGALCLLGGLGHKASVWVSCVAGRAVEWGGGSARRESDRVEKVCSRSELVSFSRWIPGAAASASPQAPLCTPPSPPLAHGRGAESPTRSACRVASPRSPRNFGTHTYGPPGARRRACSRESHCAPRQIQSPTPGRRAQARPPGRRDRSKACPGTSYRGPKMPKHAPPAQPRASLRVGWASAARCTAEGCPSRRYCPAGGHNDARARSRRTRVGGWGPCGRSRGDAGPHLNRIAQDGTIGRVTSAGCGTHVLTGAGDVSPPLQHFGPRCVGCHRPGH